MCMQQWRRQDFVTGGSEVWVYRGSRVRSPPVPVVLSVYQRCSLLDGLAMYLSCDTKKFHDNESTHILHNFWTSTHRGEASPLAAPLACNHVNGMLSAWRHYNRTPVKPCSAEHFLKCSLTVAFRLNSHINHRITFAFWMYWMMKSQLNSAAAAQ